MFGISGTHLLILGIILLIFGPRRLPEVGTKVGKAVRNFKDAFAGIQEPRFRRLGDLPDEVAPKANEPTSDDSSNSSSPS